MMPTHTSAKSLLIAFFALVGLATLSLAYSLLHGPGGTVVALVIAAIKASIVLWVFMQLRGQSVSSALAMVLAVLWIAILGGLMVADVRSRAAFPARPAPTSEDAFYRR